VTRGVILPDRGLGGLFLATADCVGPAFQTSGPSAGQVAMIMQLAGCNLACPACEVPQTWDWSRFAQPLHSREFSVHQLVCWVLASTTRLVAISGGEPLLQQAELVPLVRCVHDAGRWVEIETNGTCVPDPALVAVTGLFVVSPRLSRLGAGSSPAQRIHPAALASFVDSERAVFTFAVTHPSELDEIAELEQRFALPAIWVQPTGAAAGARPSWLADAALERGWHLSRRLHLPRPW